jgi:hypothetical protein
MDEVQARHALPARTLLTRDTIPSVNIFIWALALLAHAACRSFGGLLVARFVLGMCEGCITPGFMVVTSMFYTRDEQMRRVGWWCALTLAPPLRHFPQYSACRLDQWRCDHSHGPDQLWRPARANVSLQAVAMVRVRRSNMYTLAQP